MAEFISNITFGKSKADEILETIEEIFSLPPVEHCCECTPHLCPEYERPRTCQACDDWLYS